MVWEQPSVQVESWTLTYVEHFLLPPAADFMGHRIDTLSFLCMRNSHPEKDGQLVHVRPRPREGGAILCFLPGSQVFHFEHEAGHQAKFTYPAGVAPAEVKLVGLMSFPDAQAVRLGRPLRSDSVSPSGQISGTGYLKISRTPVRSNFPALC